MKSILPLIISSLLLLAACAQQQNTSPEFMPETEAEMIAAAYGCESFEEVAEMTFTFNVKANPDKPAFARSWQWNRLTSEITYEGPNEKGETISYSFKRSELDTTDQQMVQMDARFTNDQFWLLFPFHLVRDEGTTITEQGTQPMPIGGKEAQKLTIRYGDEGGYTPGDAYEVYYDGESYRVHQWVYMRGGDNEKKRPYRWADHKEVGPIIVATDFYGPDSTFHLYFTDLSVKMKGEEEFSEAVDIDQMRRLNNMMRR